MDIALQNHEKLAFFKFFITYFISVAILILVAGYLYFSQMRDHYLKGEEFSLIEYARHIKMDDNFDHYTNEYRYSYQKLPQQHIDIRNFTDSKVEFSKLIPMNHNLDYLRVYKLKKHYLSKIWTLKKYILLSQMILLLLFALISYKLARNALKPLKDSLSKLDKFTKDLIHDLNTPATSINLNMQILKKIPNMQENKAFKRVQTSVNNILELHENLTILLEEETFQMQNMNLCELIVEVVETQNNIYKEINITQECKDFKVKINANAMKQILQNIISNACKYNIKNGFVKIYTKDYALYIEDSGTGIEEVEKIFNRLYSAKHSSGIGLDIVKRLAEAMKIEIDVKTSSNGSIFILKFKELENSLKY